MDRTPYRFRFGTAEFDESRFELKVAGVPVDIERRAMDVLAYLLHHAGEVVTKEELLREVWAGRVTVEKVLPNAIGKIRRALGQDNALRVTTQAKIGYLLDGVVTRVAVGRAALTNVDISAGMEVPGRANFVLGRQLGAHRGSEVWLAEHRKTREKRVYKFALDADRLRSLKRETTLLRVLHDALEDSSAFVDLLDWNLEEPPYFVECEYGGENLLEWAASELPNASTDQRIELFLQIVDAVDLAHSVGVLHKDIKPANLLVSIRGNTPHIKLTDFGSGRMLDPEKLQSLGITQQGMTATQDLALGSYSGTPLYIAPEVFAGRAPTVRSDVYALGILLYQMLTGRLREPLASGWESEIDDPLIREDIRLATHVDPDSRIPSAAIFGDRLRNLAARHAERLEKIASEVEAAKARVVLASNRARRPLLIALILAMAIGTTIAVALQQQARNARLQAEAELSRATAMLQFIEEDLLDRANPLVLGKGANASIKDVLSAAREQIDTRFVGQPLTAASLRLSFATLFNTLDLWPESETEARLALATFEKLMGPDGAETLRARATRARVLSRLSRFEDAKAELDRLEAATMSPGAVQAPYHHAVAASTYHMTRGAFVDAIPVLERAIAELDRARARPGVSRQRDSLVLDLIVALGVAGQTQEAIDTYEAFEGDLNGRGGDASLLRALAQLAVARSVSLQGDHAHAETLLLKAKKVIVDQLGADHSRHLGLINELMAVYFRQASWSSALPLAREVHERIRDKLGDNHSMTWVSLGNMGRALYESGSSTEASDVLREAHQRLSRLLGADSPQAQDLAFVLACSELSNGRAEAARKLVDALDAATLERGNATGLWQARIQLLQGVLAKLDGRADTAVSLLEEALKSHPDDEAEHRSRLLREATASLRALQGS